ncbi:MAG: helix-turn-helix domain-containing protein [Cyclobacteriaceae bacterium]
MLAEIHTLHQSDFYEIRDFRCRCVACEISKPEESSYFFICFVRSGFYEQRVYKREYPVHVGRLLISKPGIEQIIRHVNNQPDLCTSFRFTHSFYEIIKEQYKREGKWFFSNPDIHSLLLVSHPDIELIHQRILKLIRVEANLEVDELVIHMLDRLMAALSNIKTLPPLSESLLKNHLPTIEKATSFLFENFDKKISLTQLADHCCVSPFHFSRIFKAVTNQSPHQYLTEVRLNHARHLLKATSQSVTQVAFESGFSSLEYFTTAYRLRFKTSPRTDSIPN